MKNTIKIIDLFILIANNKQVPKLIKYKNIIYEFREDINDYVSDNYYFTDQVFETSDVKVSLNDEVEILDEPKEIKKLDITIENPNTGNSYLINENGVKCYMTKHSKTIANKLNEVIDVVNKITEKE